MSTEKYRDEKLARNIVADSCLTKRQYFRFAKSIVRSTRLKTFVLQLFAVLHDSGINPSWVRQKK